MIKHSAITASILFLFSIVLIILIWRASLLFNSIATMLPEAVINSEAEHDTKTTLHKEATNFKTSPPITDDSNSRHYETIEETIARIKRDAIVTGTVTGTAGEESAIFQIKSMPDRSFNINTQLMDSFIITDISQNQIILKNQMGNESFSMTVQSGNLSESIETDLFNSKLMPGVGLPGVGLPEAEPPEAEPPEAELPEAGLPEAELPGTEFAR